MRQGAAKMNAQAGHIAGFDKAPAEIDLLQKRGMQLDMAGVDRHVMLPHQLFLTREMQGDFMPNIFE